MSVRTIQISTKSYACRATTCECWRNKQVTVEVGSARTWGDVRHQLAREMQVPAEAIALWQELGIFDMFIASPLPLDEPSEEVMAVFAQEVRE